MLLRVVVIGAGRSHKNEAAIGRAVESLGLPCLLINAVTWTQNLGRLAAPLLQRRIQAFEPDVLICSRHALLLGEARLRTLFRHRYSAFWYFDLRIPPIKDVITLGRMVDIMYTTYAPQVEVFRRHGIERVLHLPQGMDPELDRPATGTESSGSFISRRAWTRSSIARPRARSPNASAATPSSWAAASSRTDSPCSGR